MNTPTGRCHCGAVTVTVPENAFGVIACHCDDCQKMHGNFFAMVAAAEADVTVEGVDHVQWYTSSAVAQRAFCRTCGSRLFKRPNASGRLLVSVGLFGPDTGLQIHKQVWTENKPDWYTLPSTV